MSHLTAEAPAVVLGAGVGVASGLYARRALRQAIGQGHRDDGEQSAARPAPGWLLGAAGVVIGALLGARFGMRSDLTAFLYLAAITPALGAIDAATRKLPNRILLPAYPLTVALLGFASWRNGDVGALWRALLAAALLFAVLLTVALVAPGSLGFGDVKLAGLLGLFTGFLGWATVWLAMMAAFGLAAVYVVVRALVRRGQRGRVLALGPALLLGSLVAVIVS